MGIFDRVKKAYTLAEIIIVLVVISVVVAVTMRVAKTRLDNVTTYTYYSAYGILNDVTAQMLADFNESNNDYMDGTAAPVAPAEGEEVPSQPATVPRNGENFCKMFVALVNTKAGGGECGGSAIEADVMDFSEITSDMTLRNGMKIYNASQDVAQIADLNGNTAGGSFTKDDGILVSNTNEWGYTLYVDIDGENSGDSMLWEDVFPFYVTLSGKVIPAYKTDSLGEFGGDSRYYMQTSVQVDTVNSVGATQYWLLKSKSFKESACATGYVGDGTQYCKRGTAVPQNAVCKQETTSCSVKKVSPIRGF